MWGEFMTYKRNKDKKKIPRQLKETIKNINNFIRKNADELAQHYYSVIREDSKEQKLAKNSNIYEEVELYDYNAELLKVSVVILTANFFECEILNYNVWEGNQKKIKKLKDGIDVFPHKNFRRPDAFLLEINNYNILHLHAPETGSNTPCGSTDLVRYVTGNKYLYPACIISFGVCYGIEPEKQTLSNTIIANKVYPCSIGLKVNDDGWNVKHDEYVINLYEKDTRLYHKIEEVISGKKNKASNINFSKVEIGNMLTGEAVINNEKVKIESIEKSYGCNIVGGEMEGYGLAKESIYYSDIPCVIIKAICDWGTCKNIKDYLEPDLPEKSKFDTKGQIQAFAAYCAYTVLNKLFWEEIFPSDNVLKTVEEDIIRTYLVNGYIPEKVLKNHVQNFLKQNYANERLVVQNASNLKNVLIEQCLAYRLIKCENEGMSGYMVNGFSES